MLYIIFIIYFKILNMLSFASIFCNKVCNIFVCIEPSLLPLMMTSWGWNASGVLKPLVIKAVGCTCLIEVKVIFCEVSLFSPSVCCFLAIFQTVIWRCSICTSTSFPLWRPNLTTSVKLSDTSPSHLSYVLFWIQFYFTRKTDFFNHLTIHVNFNLSNIAHVWHLKADTNDIIISFRRSLFFSVSLESRM
jgi:hypothetical protein